MASGAKGPRAGQPKRRAFTAAYKLKIVEQYEQLADPRERGALLRREGAVPRVIGHLAQDLPVRSQLPYRADVATEEQRPRLALGGVAERP